MRFSRRLQPPRAEPSNRSREVFSSLLSDCLWRAGDGHLAPADRLGGGELPRLRRLRGHPLLRRLLPRRPFPPRLPRLRVLAKELIFKKGDGKLDPTTYAGKRKIRKFKESAWKCICFLSGEILALSVTYNELWFTITRNFWGLTRLKLKAVYMYVAGFYTYSIFALLFWETRRSDSGISMIHHVATVFLITLLTYSVVLAIHDASDVFLELGKISKYGGRQLLADASFLLFVCSWVVLRLIYYPFWILWSTSYEVVLTLDKEKHKFDGPIYYYVFNSLLFSLLVLHIYWWVLMYRMLVRQMQSRGHVGDDIRSDSEGEEEHED